MNDSLRIKEALNSASNNISMDKTLAKNTLMKALSEANMSTNVAFTPVISAAIIAKPKINVTNIAATTAAGATVLAVASFNPTISNINYSDIITNKPVELYVELSTSMGVHEIYAENSLGDKYYGYDSNGKYVIEVIDNGKYDVVVVSDVGTKDSSTINVYSIDKLGPTVSDSILEGNTWSFRYSDEMSLVDLGSAYAVVEGNKMLPVSIDTASNTVSYEYDGDKINIYVRDNLGNISDYLIEK